MFAAECQSYDIATMIGSSVSKHAVQTLTIDYQPRTSDLVVGGSAMTYDDDTGKLVGFIYYLDHSECEIRWMLDYQDELTSITSVVFHNGGSTIVATGENLDGSTSEKYLIVIKDYHTRATTFTTAWPAMRTWMVEETTVTN